MRDLKGLSFPRCQRKKVHELSYQLNLLQDKKREGCHLKAAI